MCQLRYGKCALHYVMNTHGRTQEQATLQRSRPCPFPPDAHRKSPSIMPPKSKRQKKPSAKALAAKEEVEVIPKRPRGRPRKVSPSDVSAPEKKVFFLFLF